MRYLARALASAPPGPGAPSNPAVEGFRRGRGKIANLQAWDRAVREGIRMGDHEPDDPPMVFG